MPGEINVPGYPQEPATIMDAISPPQTRSRKPSRKPPRSTNKPEIKKHFVSLGKISYSPRAAQTQDDEGGHVWGGVRTDGRESLPAVPDLPPDLASGTDSDPESEDVVRRRRKRSQLKRGTGRIKKKVSAYSDIQSEEDSDATCPGCGNRYLSGPFSHDYEWICCDTCQTYWHEFCGGVIAKDYAGDREWVCLKCQHSSPPAQAIAPPLAQEIESTLPQERRLMLGNKIFSLIR